MSRTLYYFLASSLLSLALPAAGWAMTVQQPIQGTLSLIGGEVIQFETYSSEPILIRDLRLGPEWYALDFSSGNQDRIIASVLRVSPREKNLGLHLDIIERSIEPGLPLYGSPLNAYLAEWQITNRELPQSAADVCCVSCGKVTVCGGSVIMSCGTCGIENNLAQ